MSESKVTTLWVNVPLKGEDIARFERVKATLGLTANTEVVRHLLSEADRRLARVGVAQSPSEGKPRTGAA